MPVRANGIDDAAARADREPRDDRRRARRRPHRHGREPAGRHQVARGLRGAGRRRAAHRAPRAREARHRARSRAAQARPRRAPTPTWSTTACGSRRRARRSTRSCARSSRASPASVRLKLFKGDCRVVGRKSPFALYDQASRPTTRRSVRSAARPKASSRSGGFRSRLPRARQPRTQRRSGADHGAPLVRTVRGRSRRGAVRVRRVVPVRSPPVRGRRAGKPGVGGGARARRRAFRSRRGRDSDRAAGDPRARGSRIRHSSTATPQRQDEDVHAFVERELSARVGDAGRRLHTGRSRNEQVAVDLRLYLKRRVPLLQRGLRGADCAGLRDRRRRAATR